MRTRYWSVATALVFSSLLACSPEPSPPGAESAGVPTPSPIQTEPDAGEVKAEAGEVEGPDGAEAVEGEDAAEDEGELADPVAAYDRASLEALKPIGVKFCDGYIDAYRKCIIFNVDDADKAAHAATLIHEHENWARTKAGAADVAATALEVGCRSAHAQAAQKTAELNCAWP